MKGFTPKINQKFHREDYEHACSELGFAPVPDAQLGDYGDQFGDWRPVHTDEHWLTSEPQAERWLRQQRWFQIKRERGPEPIVQRRSRQLHAWGTQGTRYEETCESCGRETEIDNTTSLCRRCHERMGQ